MRNPNRLDNFYDELRNIHKSEFPDWRFGQFMMNFLSWVYGKHGKDPFYIEEDTCVEYLNEYADAITNPFYRRMPMGTNYYFYLTDKDVAHGYFATKEEYGVFDEEYELIDDPYFCYKIHLNKCSCGWRTLFQEHKCFSSFKELEHFYHEHKDCLRIFDEYGEEFTWEKYKDEVISRNYIDKKPMKWVYEENEWCGRPGVKYLDTKECAEEEAELYLPFDHCEYNRTEQIARRKFCPYDRRYDLYVTYWNDPDYPVDWTEGEFS